MKRWPICSLYLMLIVTLFPLSAMAKDQRTFGLGVILGEPTGLSAKLWTSRTTALDGSLAWSFGRKDAFHMHGDFLLHDYSLIKISEGKLPVYYGIGGRLKLQVETLLGVRFPLGLNYQFARAPFDIFIEIVPILELIPATDFNMNAAIGVRFFFDSGR